jgi:quinol monooxygenase YgiN
MSRLVIAIDTSEVRPGKLEEVERAVDDLAKWVESNEPRPIAYHVYLDRERGRMTVLQIHPDSASMENHLEMAGPAFRPFVDLIDLTSMEVFGTPSDELLARLQEKVGLLGHAAIVVHELQAGFSRFGSS